MIRWAAALAVAAVFVTGQTPADVLKTLPRTAKLADYTAFFAASVAFDAQHDAAVGVTLKPVWAMSPRSPLAGRAAILASQAYLRSGNSRYALETLNNLYGELAQPDGDLALAKAAEAAADLAGAAGHYQRVYYNFPSTPAAGDADEGLARLQKALGSSFPPTTPQSILGRADKLMSTGLNRQAAAELLAILPALTSADRDSARLRIGATKYNLRENATALEYFRALEVTAGEGDAERLFWIVQCARRLNNRGEVSRTLDELARQYPRSKWRVEALVNAAAYHVVANQASEYEPLFKACYEFFPDSPRAAECHWRVAFNEYLRRGPNATKMLMAHSQTYPKSDHIPAAMYFLGRLAEQAGNAPAARGYYEAIDRSYPNYYYAVLARERMPAGARHASVRAAIPFNPNAAAQFRIERADLLAGAGLDDLADAELRYGATKEDQPQVMAMALARLALKREMPARAIRYMKRYAPNYLQLPMDSAPIEFWKLAFPLPYQEPLTRFAKAEELDPFLIAALIRQESEFDANVISRAKAYGLTQVLPSTGRELARKAGMKHFSTKMLFRPELNLQFGTRYLKTMLNSLDNRLEATLAAYNAGKSRSVAWLSWFDYREPAEFVEAIPFNETRTYVQSVIRNADIYRRIYGGQPPAAAAAKNSAPR